MLLLCGRSLPCAQIYRVKLAYAKKLKVLKIMIQIAKKKSLSDRDILLWVEETVAKLKAREFEGLDLENLIEEVESLGISQKKELLSRLTTLFEHLLKRIYVDLPDDFNAWERTIRNQWRELKLLLYQVPSLKSRWNEYLSMSYELALADVKSEYKSASFPNVWEFSIEIEAMLNVNFWE